MTAPSADIRIDIVSDVVCPWCIIGFKQLERALGQLQPELGAEIHWHPFELNPQMPAGGQGLREHLAQKYGTTVEQSSVARSRLTQIAESLGVEFRFYDGKGIHAVPSIILDQRYLIPGAQDPEVFVAALKKLAEEKAA
ncbi:MAG: DsbA family protein [Polyangiales bacterium]